MSSSDGIIVLVQTGSTRSLSRFLMAVLAFAFLIGIVYQAEMGRYA